MGFGYIAAGLCFLFNPNISIFDVIPDFIGYLLIYRGLYYLAFPSGRLQDVRKTIGKLILITAAHFFSLALLPLSDGETFSLTIVFTFAVLETVYLIPAFIGLFDGFYELGTYFQTESVFDVRMVSAAHGKNKGAAKKIEGAERLKTFTIVFFLIKNTANLLPELTALQSADEMSSGSRLFVSLSSFKPLFYLFFSLIVTIFGVIWLVRGLRYMHRLRCDQELNRRISLYYEEKVAQNPGMIAALRMKKVRMLFIVSAALSVMIVMDGVNVLPNALACACEIGALYFLYKETRSVFSVIGMGAAGVAGILSGINLFLQIQYFDEYAAKASHYIANAAVMYRSVCVWGAVEYILLLVMYLAAAISFGQAVRKHSAYVGVTDSVQIHAETRRQELVRPVQVRLIVSSVVCAIYCILSAAYFRITVFHSAIFLVDVAVCLLWIVTVVQTMHSAHENIYERLELDY